MDTSTAGLVGEIKVQRLLNACKIRFGIKYISNLPLYCDGTYYQVDDVVVCTRGFYALEVKNWNCEINCGNQRYWKVKYPTREIVVKSPLAQNTRHCNKIYTLTGSTPTNIVVFTEGAKLKNPPENVMLLSQFSQFLSSQNEVLTQEQVDTLANSLAEYKRAIEPQMLLDFIIKRAKI